MNNCLWTKMNENTDVWFDPAMPKMIMFVDVAEKKVIKKLQWFCCVKYWERALGMEDFGHAPQTKKNKYWYIF